MSCCAHGVQVQIVEAFFELERTLEAALAAARLPKAPPQALHPAPHAVDIHCSLWRFILAATNTIS